MLLDKYTDIHPMIDNYELFMAFHTLMWHMAGRPGLSKADQQMHAESAHTIIIELLDIDPYDSLLQWAHLFADELVKRTDDDLLLEVHEEDFQKWMADLPSVDEVIAASDKPQEEKGQGD